MFAVPEQKVAGSSAAEKSEAVLAFPEQAAHIVRASPIPWPVACIFFAGVTPRGLSLTLDFGDSKLLLVPI